MIRALSTEARVIHRPPHTSHPPGILGDVGAATPRAAGHTCGRWGGNGSRPPTRSPDPTRTRTGVGAPLSPTRQPQWTDAANLRPVTRTMTLKAGRIAPTWHAAHILLSTLTCGWWLIVYAAHALIFAATRPAITVEVPDGHRVEYRNGWPNVLGPDEYLEPRTGREQALRIAGYLSPLLILAGILLGLAARA